MDTNSEQDVMNTCLATMMVCEQQRAIREGLLGVYEVVKTIEQNHDISPGVDDLRTDIVENFEKVMSIFPHAPPEGFNLEELSKCFGALLWSLRMVEIVKETESKLEAMASAHDFISRLQGESFRESNR